MKKITTLMLTLFLVIVAQAQIIQSDPAFITKDFTGEIEIIYDASLGNKGLLDFTGDVYAHTGVITSESTGDSDWKHAPSWGDNSEKFKLTSLGNNKWKLIITPNMSSYYDLNPGETIKKIAFVFRSADKTKEGKGVGNSDIFVNVYEAGLHIDFTNPSTDKAVTVGTTENIQFNSSVPANLELFINRTSVKTANNTTTLSHSYTFSNTIDYQLVATASVGGETVSDTINISVPAPVVEEARPTGYKDGITYSDDGTQATLILYAPGKQNVFVIGDFNNWAHKNDYQLKKDGDYWWITLTDLEPGKIYGFQYLVDGNIRIADAYTELALDPWSDKWINEHHLIYPDIPQYPNGKTTGLVGTLQSKKPVYNWEVPSFTFENQNNAVIYEMLIRDFTDERSLAAAIEKLDYLQTLGITAIELMPIQEFDGNNSWGYNPNLYFAPDKAYGTPEMYKKFIDECHKRDIAVILDMVFNQANGLHPFALLYWDGTNNKPTAENPWMNVDAPHLFSVLNDFDHSFVGTREYFKRVLEYWITEYKVDGYRLDLTKGFTQNSGTESSFDQSRIDYLTEYYDAVKAVDPNAMFIIEHLVGGSEEDLLASKGIFLWRNVNSAYSQAAMGFQDGADFNAMNSFPRQWVGYAESHDEERNFYKAKAYGNGVIKNDETIRLNRVPLNIAFTVLTPGPKMIWQFGELGFDHSINSFGGRTDPKPAVWDWLDNPVRKMAYDKSSKIISLKKKYPKAFMEGNYSLNIGGGDWNAGKRIALEHAYLNMVMLGNFQSENTITAYPNFPKTGMWYDLLTGEELNVTNKNMTLQIEAGDVKIYTDKKVDDSTGIDGNFAETSFSIIPNVVKDELFINSKEPITKATIYNSQGTLMKIFKNTSKLNVNEFSAGIYLIEIKTEKTNGVTKFIKR